MKNSPLKGIRNYPVHLFNFPVLSLSTSPKTRVFFFFLVVVLHHNQFYDVIVKKVIMTSRN